MHGASGNKRRREVYESATNGYAGNRGSARPRTGLPSGNRIAYQGEEAYEDGNICLSGETLLPEQTRTYTVVGFIKRPNFEPTWAPGYTAISFLDARAPWKPDDEVTVTLLADKLKHGFFEDVEVLLRNVWGWIRLNIRYNTELLRYSGVFMQTPVCRTCSTALLRVFIAIIIIASVSLIYNAFAISISERVSQLGMLASVGATRGQKRHSVYFEGFLLGIIGIPFGILARRLPVSA